MNSRNNLIPNIWCLCKVSINPNILAISTQHVSFTISENSTTFAVSAIYASTNYITRRSLWSELQQLQSQHNLQWCFIGDFNIITGAREHRGRFPPARTPIKDFCDWTDINNLIHLPTRGSHFTWANGRYGSRYTEKRLDRAVCNHLWIDSCHSLTVSTLTKHHSDHFPLLLDFKNTPTTFTSQFRFMKMWSHHSDCQKLIEDTWNIQVLGSPMFVLSHKLKTLKERLKIWNRETFGNVHVMVKDAENNLKDLQECIDVNGHKDLLLEQEKMAQIEYQKALDIEEAFWQEKSKTTWHLEGDRNTSYFHRITKIKQATKLITSLRDCNHIINDPEQIAFHTTNHFQNLFCSSSVL